jgi:signal transduction histidine kinase
MAQDASGGPGGTAPRAPGTSVLRPLGLAVIAVIVTLSAQQHPAPALDGEGLIVTIALAVLVLAVAALMRYPDGSRVRALAPLAMIVASGTLLWTQNGDSAQAGLFVATGLAALRLPLRGALVLAALATVALVAPAIHAQRSAGGVVASELGVLAFFVLALFARRVQDAHEQTAQLLAELEATRHAAEDAAALRERGRIAREIHDVLAHSLSGLMLQLEGARMLAAQPSVNGELPETLDRAHHLARAGLEEARRAIGALRDDTLPGPDGLRRLATDFSRDSDVAADLTVTGVPHPLDSETSLTLFRVAQEALTNSRKHSHPQRVELRLAYEPDGTRLVIEDHGTGRREPAGQAPGPGGYGLTGMRERAELLGGRLEAAPSADGFRVELWVPA